MMLRVYVLRQIHPTHTLKLFLKYESMILFIVELQLSTEFSFDSIYFSDHTCM